MQKKKPETLGITLETFRRFYNPGTVAGRLEDYLQGREIGDPSWRKRLEIKKGKHAGSTRSASLNLEKPQRAFRTWTVMRLTQAQLDKIHRHEQDFRVSFLTGPGQMRLLLRLPERELQNEVFLNEAAMEEMTEITEKARPEMRLLNSVAGFELAPSLPIPPYFIYDNDFDGMNYHHAIDRNVWEMNQ